MHGIRRQKIIRTRKKNSSIATAMLIALASLGVTTAGISDEAYAQPLFPTGADGLYIGHSYFFRIAEVFNQIADDQDYPDHHFEAVFSDGKTGSPWALWNDEDKREMALKVLRDRNVELFALTFHDQPNIKDPRQKATIDDYIVWIDEAIRLNDEPPKILIGLPWPPHGPRMNPKTFQQANDKLITEAMPLFDELRAYYAARPENVEIYVLHYGGVISTMAQLYQYGELEDLRHEVAETACKEQDIPGLRCRWDGDIYVNDRFDELFLNVSLYRDEFGTRWPHGAAHHGPRMDLLSL